MDTIISSTIYEFWFNLYLFLKIGWSTYSVFKVIIHEGSNHRQNL